MPTERLYYNDSYLRRFEGMVIARSAWQGRPAVALDRSAFYPEGGGQPADQGMLNGIAVLDVQQDDDGLVWHVLAARLDTDQVVGEIDWTRRFDHMQQHHGQHLLSAAYEQLYALRTVSFHLGADGVTIDLAGALQTAEQAAAVEDLVNQVIWEDRPVVARFVGADELATIALRKPPSVDGPIRVVSVPDFDHSACGGTHPRSTGGVGALHIRRWERRGDILRVEFVCGGRALRDLRWKNAALGRLAAGLSIGADELELAIGRLREAEERARRGLEEARGRLIGYEAQELAARAQMIGGVPVAYTLAELRSLDELRALARQVADRGCVALVGMAGEKGHLIIARGEGLPVDAARILRAALTPLGGKGGGRPELAQGGLPDGTRIGEALELAIAELAR